MPSNPDRRLKLTVQTQSLYDPNLTQNYKLIIDASNGNLMPNEVFRFVRVEPITGYPVGYDQFKGVCTPSELTTLPVDEPMENSVNLFFRTAHVELDFITEAEATSAWTEILDSVNALKRALDFGDGLSTTTYWVGTAE
jgi:hypothetical protein